MIEHMGGAVLAVQMVTIIALLCAKASLWHHFYVGLTTAALLSLVNFAACEDILDFLARSSIWLGYLLVYAVVYIKTKPKRYRGAGEHERITP